VQHLALWANDLANFVGDTALLFNMAVTELALLQYKSPPSPSSSLLPIPDSVLEILYRAAREQTSFSGHSVALLQCHEDPTLIYLIGGWDTVAQHMNEWIPKQTNQELMKELGQGLDVKWMFHLDMNPADVLHGVVGATRGFGAEGKDGVVAIGRHFIRHSQRVGFTATFEDNVDALEEFLGDFQKRDSGWRVDRGFVADAVGDAEDNMVPDEFVVFTAWSSVERHVEFVKPEGFQRYSKIREYVERAEIRHVKMFYVGEL